MKESKLIEMQNTIDALKRVAQQTINELNHLTKVFVTLVLEMLQKLPIGLFTQKNRKHI